MDEALSLNNNKKSIVSNYSKGRCTIGMRSRSKRQLTPRGKSVKTSAIYTEKWRLARFISPRSREGQLVLHSVEAVSIGASRAQEKAVCRIAWDEEEGRTCWKDVFGKTPLGKRKPSVCFDGQREVSFVEKNRFPEQKKNMSKVMCG